METAIRWSPTSTTTEQRFLLVDVTGKAFRLCRVTGFEGSRRSSLDYEVLSTHTKVPAFRAFDWSPVDESLVAVGQSSGDATILRMPSSATAAGGGGSGDASSGDLAQQLLQQETFSFPIRSQRHCNAVAFSSHGLLAAGLDRVRNDFCLNIWDMNQRLSMRGGKGFAEPLRKLASSESITSTKFFRDQPDTLVAGVKGQYVRLYDLREGPGSPSLQFPTRCVHNLAINWLDENYIASCSSSNDTTVCVWDRRVGSRFTAAAVGPANALDTGQAGPSLEFKNVFAPKSSIWSARFSRTRSGCLSILSNTGHFKNYNIAKEYLSEEYRASMDETLGQGSFKNYPEQVYTKHVRDVCSPFNHPSRGCKEPDRVVSFDSLNMGPSNEPSAVTLAGNGHVGIITLQPPAPPVQLSSQGVLVRGGPGGDVDFKAVSPSSDPDASISDTVQKVRERMLPSLDEDNHGLMFRRAPAEGQPARPLSSHQTRERDLSLGAVEDRLTAKEALTLLTVSRRRCKEGYLFDGARNKQILADDPYLQDFWGWIERARADSSGQSMIIHNMDLNYLGVSNVWNDDFGESLRSRQIGPNAAQYSVHEVIVDLVRDQLNLPEAKGFSTSYPEHRRLCLRLCGAAQSYRALEEIVKTLSSENQHTKAAALAIFQKEHKLAYMALRTNEPAQAHTLLAMAIAGAAKGEADTDWEETCAEIVKDLTDPYARAILALVSKGDWNSVIQETTLPLKYRVEVALRWLPDEQLTAYLKEATAEAIRQGDIEGIVLTGLGHSALDLFQSYINKFNDIQTPVLAMSHTVPRFINNDSAKTRFDAWRETFRWQMNSWKLQLERARFDVGSRKFAVTWDGRRLIEPPRQQVSLTCNYCTKPLTQHQHDALPAQLAPSTGIGGEVIHPTIGNPLGTAVMSGIVCPSCGRHMPRCGVCSFWLGAPDPMSKASIAADSSATGTTEQEQQRQQRKPTENELMKRFIVFCINCNHGFHAHHAREWFMKHRVCPVAECNCICDR